MSNLARIRKLLKPPRPLVNSTSPSKPRDEQTPEIAEESSESKVYNRADVPESVSILKGVSDPCELVGDCVPPQNSLQSQSNASGQNAASPPTNRPAQWSESGTGKRDDEAESSGNGAPDNPHGGLSITLNPEDAAKILDTLDILQSQEAWLDAQLTNTRDLARKQNEQYRWLVKKHRGQEQSSESSAAKRQAEHDAEKKKAQEEAQANQETARTQIRALESELRRMREEKKQVALEMEKNQLVHADAEQKIQLARRRSRLEQQSRELDVQLWREWGEENERKLQAWKDKSRIKNAQVLSRLMEGVKLFQALKAHADVQRQRIRELREQLHQQYIQGSTTLLPDIDFDTRKLVEIVNNAEKVMTTFIEPLPSAEFSLELSNSDINDDNLVAHGDSLLANLHILDESASIKRSASLSSPSPIVSRKSNIKVESGTWPSSPTSSSSDIPIPSNLSHQTRSGPEISTPGPSSTMQQFNTAPLVGFTQYTETGVLYQEVSAAEKEMISAWARVNGNDEFTRMLRERAEAQELAERNLARLRHERVIREWEKRKEDARVAEAQQRWKEEIEQDEKWERKRKRRVEHARFEEMRTRAKRQKRTDEEVHALICQLPGGFPADQHRPRLPWQQGPQPPRTPSVKRRLPKPLPETRRTLSTAQRAVCERVARIRARRRERRGISLSRRTLRRHRRGLKMQMQEQMRERVQDQAQHHPHPATPKPQSPAPERKVRFLVDSSPVNRPCGRPFRHPLRRSVRRSANRGVYRSANGPVNPPASRPDTVRRSRFSRLIQFLRDRPLAVVCTVMATACAVEMWRLWRYEQEYLNANDMPQRIQDMLRAESQSWEWWRILEYDLLKGEDRTRMG